MEDSNEDEKMSEGELKMHRALAKRNADRALSLFIDPNGSVVDARKWLELAVLEAQKYDPKADPISVIMDSVLESFALRATARASDGEVNTKEELVQVVTELKDILELIAENMADPPLGEKEWTLIDSMKDMAEDALEVLREV